MCCTVLYPEALLMQEIAAKESQAQMELAGSTLFEEDDLTAAENWATFLECPGELLGSG